MWICTERQPHSEAKSHNKDMCGRRRIVCTDLFVSFYFVVTLSSAVATVLSVDAIACWRDVLDINFGSIHLHFLWKMDCYLWILLEPTPEVVFYLYILPIGGIFIIIFSFMCSQLSSSVFRCFSLIFQVEKVPSDWSTSHLAEEKWRRIFHKSISRSFLG